MAQPVEKSTILKKIMVATSKFKIDNYLLAQVGNSAPEFDRPIFIICAPRSGSTFFYHSIRRMSEVFSFGRENTPMWIRIFPYTRSFPPSDYISPEECNKSIEKSLKAFILLKGAAHGFSFENPDSRNFDLSVALQHWVKRKPIRYMEKTIANCFHLEAIEKMFPDALFIHLVRDGRANVSSMIEGWDTFVKVGLDFTFSPDATIPYWSYALPPGWEETIYCPIEEISAWSWIEHNRYVLNRLSSDPGFASRYLKIFYEDFLENPVSVVRRVSEFCDLQNSDSCMNYVRSRPLSRTTISRPSLYKWKQKNGDKILRIMTLIQPMMQQLGYKDFRC